MTTYITYFLGYYTYETQAIDINIYQLFLDNALNVQRYTEPIAWT
jgi:hypothetical protein